MKNQLPILLSRYAPLVLSAIALVLAFVHPGPFSFFLLLGAGLNLALVLPARKRQLGLSLAFLAVLGLLVPRPAQAIFGFGDIVFDPTSYATLGKIWSSDVSMVTKLAQEVQQMTKLYNNAKDRYDLAQRMAKAIESKNPYALQSAIRMGNAYVADHFGEAAGWSQAINQGLSIPAAYGQATLQQRVSGAFLAAERLGASSHLTSLARVGITDDTAQRTMSVAAQIQQQQNANANSVQQWQRSVLSHDPDLNTAAAQQNLTNLGMVQLYEQGRATLAVNSLLAQQFMLQNMKDRDLSVSALNRWQKMSDYAATETFTLGGMEADLHNHQPY